MTFWNRLMGIRVEFRGSFVLVIIFGPLGFPEVSLSWIVGRPWYGLALFY